jgi:subtilase family serine protease
MLPTSFRSSRLFVATTLGLAAFLAAPVCAQTAQPPLAVNRIAAAIDESTLVTLKGTVHPLANAANDRGAAPDSMPLQRLHLVLKRSPAQEATLRQLIRDMHTPGSASYHKWLTPEQFGEQFGPSDQDIATVQSWLGAHGFEVGKVQPGKQVIEFSGNVAQMRDAFHTQIHKYVVNGETHHANAGAPQIPSALAPVVGGFVSLNNFRLKHYLRVLGKATYNTQTHTAKPEWTYGNGSGVTFPLAPADYAKQYDLSPLYAAGINGSNQTIAIVNDSNVNIDLVNQFRSIFGLSPNPPQVIIDGNDPGIDGINNPDGPNFDSGEAYLDVEWSAAIAPAATVDLVIAADTALESGLILAMEHAVYGNIAPVISLSFGACETGLSSTNSFLNSLWEQAAAQGTTVMVSAGDNGSAGCDNDNSQYYAVGGLAVSGFASTPYNVAVGGTDFFYSDYNNLALLNIQLGTYWNTTPTQLPQASLLQVIPEQPWNDSQYGLNAINYYTDISGSTATTIAGGSGGASSCGLVSTTTGACTGGYPKPAWQTGAGVPADGVRDIPDVSLYAADGANFSYIPTCASDGDCQLPSGSNLVQITGVGGTSASAPSFAGIMALVNQEHGRQGQANFVLYPLKTQFPAAFHDVTQGTNSMPCAFSPSSPNCIAVNNPITVTDPTYGTAEEGQIGTGATPDYNATAGYNLATGLGTIDANLLVTHWSSIKFASTTLNLTSPAGGTTITHGTSLTFTGTVTGTGNATPTGDVAIETNSTQPQNQGQTFFPLSGGSFTGSINYLPGGTYSVWANYGGDTTNASSASAKAQITVNPEASTTYFNILDVATPATGTVALSPGSTAVYGTQLILAAQLYPTTYYNQCFVPATPPASCNTATFTFPTGTVTFADNGITVNTAVVNAELDAEYNAPWSVGAHSVTARYSGDASYTASSAAAIPFSIVKDTPVVALSSAAQTPSGTYQGGQSTVFTIQVENSANLTNESQFSISYSNPAAAPTGTVTVSGFPAGVPTSAALHAAVDPTTNSPEGVATITAPASTLAGTYSVTISYGGDSNYTAASSGALSVTIVGATSGLLASTTAASFTGSISPTTSIAVTGTVTGQSGKAAPTGAVLFFSSGYGLSEVAISPGAGDSSSFSATLNSQSLFQGTNLITVQYSGDGVYAPSSTILNAITSPLSDFSIVPVATIVPVTAGGSAAADTVNVYSMNGFSGMVSFTCTAASGITCPAPSPVTLASGGSAPVTLNISASSSAASGNNNILLTATAGSFVHTLGIQAFVIAPAASLAPSSVFLGIQPLGTSSPKGTVTLSNTGVSALSIASIAIAGSNSSDFSLTQNCPLSLAVNAACVIQPTFKPTAAGPRKSSISISDNSGSGVQTILLTGVGAAINTAPSSLTFNSQQVGTPSTAQAVTITNEGSTVVNLWQITFLGANAGDFSKSNTSTCGSSLGAGANCAVNVIFTPAAAGSRTASLLISNDGGGSPQAVTLTGAGTSGPAARLSTSAVIFGEQAVGTSSHGEMVVLTNAGDGPLAVGNLTISGASGGDFVQTSTCGASLAAGASCTIEIKFAPRAMGTRTAVINVLRFGSLPLKVQGTGIGREPRPMRETE